MFGAGRVAVMWCCAVMIPEEGLDLLTACLQTGRKTFAAAVPPLAIQFNSSHTPILFLFCGETTRHLRSHSWFWSCNVHWMRAIWLVFPSFLFLFFGGEGKVHLVATWPWGCLREYFSWGSWLLLAAKSHTCITWKALHRFHRLDSDFKNALKRDNLTGI